VPPAYTIGVPSGSAAKVPMTTSEPSLSTIV